MKKDSKIAILGYGTEGKSTEKYLLKHGFSNITVLDENSKIESKSKQITGKNIWEYLDDFDFIFRSPGISPLRKELKLVGNKLTSNTELFFDKCPAPIIGVTGTKGKGTTSSLMYKIIENSGKKCFLGGNIGTPPLDFLDKIKKEDYVVLELSSFQTFTLNKSPYIAVILMVTSEHLDYHKDTDEYREAKSQLVKNQIETDYCIFHKDFKSSQEIAEKSKGIKIPFSPKKDIVDDMLYYKKEAIINVKDIALIGEHNWNNVLASIHVAKVLDISNDVIIKTVKEFTGLPLRLEKIAEKNGITFINDSFSTTPETSIAAINSFPNDNIAIMLGGGNKNSNFSELAKLISNNDKIFSVCLGETGEEIENEIIKNGGSNMKRVFKFDDAFNECIRHLEKIGGICLLSPACTSFDQFDNYKERGKRFNELIDLYKNKESYNND